jgi:hypothetical protein
MRRRNDRFLVTVATAAALMMAPGAGAAARMAATSGQATPAKPGTAPAKPGTTTSKPAPATSTSKPQAPPAEKGQAVNADARAMVDFEASVKKYLALHNKLEGTLPHLSKDSTPQQIDSNQRALAQLIQNARSGAKRGDFFTPAVTAVVKALLARVFGGPDGAALRSSIMDENPGKLTLKVNSRYPDTVPLSTVPPQVLEGLPKLPEELEFRFIGNRLVLMDVHAHIIVDFIENALPG